jgi:hypothetical protein
MTAGGKLNKMFVDSVPAIIIATWTLCTTRTNRLLTTTKCHLHDDLDADDLDHGAPPMRTLNHREYIDKGLLIDIL